MRNVQRTSYARRIKALSDERARLQRELREARAEIARLNAWLPSDSAALRRAREQWVDGREDGARIASEIARELHTEAQ